MDEAMQYLIGATWAIPVGLAIIVVGVWWMLNQIFG